MNDPFLPEELRLFVACELPDDWRQALQDAEHELQRAGLASLRWVRPENIHLTLKFLGEVGRHMLADIEQAMQETAEEQEAFDLRLGPLGSFGGRGRLRVVWAGVEGELRSLRHLQQRLDTALHEIGFAREIRPFSAHLTLARVGDDAPRETLAKAATVLRAVSPAAVQPLRVDGLSLMRSQLNRGGAVYSRLALARLSTKPSQVS